MFHFQRQKNTPTKRWFLIHPDGRNGVAHNDDGFVRLHAIVDKPTFIITDTEHILEFSLGDCEHNMFSNCYGFGGYYQEVKLLENNPNFKIETCSDKIWKVNEFFKGDIHLINSSETVDMIMDAGAQLTPKSLSTIQSIGLGFFYDYASKRGRTDLMYKLIIRNPNFQNYRERCIHLAQIHHQYKMIRFLQGEEDLSWIPVLGVATAGAIFYHTFSH